MNIKKFTQNARTFLILVAISSIVSGCSLFKVYKIDLPQGTPITQQQATQVKVGMNPNQVLYILGSPALTDTLAPNRWDYIYDYKAGTHGQRAGKQDIQNASQHLVIYFNNNQVAKIEGLETLPVSP